MPGFAELVLILFIAFIIFGAGKLPAIATSMGKAIQRLRSEQSPENQDEDEEEGGGAAT